MRLKELREIKKITQSKLAREINMPLITYTKYENNIREPKLEILIKLANYYGVTLDYLVGREFNNEFGYLGEDEKELLKAYRTLNRDNKFKLLGEAQGMSKAQG